MEEIQNKIWELVVSKLGDNTDSDMLTDQIMDVIAPSINRLKAYDEEISKEMPLDFKDWWEGSKDEWPEVARMCLEGRREREEWCNEVIDSQQEKIKELEGEILELERNISWNRAIKE
jgi:hypothetical protein